MRASQKNRSRHSPFPHTRSPSSASNPNRVDHVRLSSRYELWPGHLAFTSPSSDFKRFRKKTPVQPRLRFLCANRMSEAARALRRGRFLLTKRPALLKLLSTAAGLLGTARTCMAAQAMSGRSTARNFHRCKTSKDKDGCTGKVSTRWICCSMESLICCTASSLAASTRTLRFRRAKQKDICNVALLQSALRCLAKLRAACLWRLDLAATPSTATTAGPACTATPRGGCCSSAAFDRARFIKELLQRSVVRMGGYCTEVLCEAGSGFTQVIGPTVPSALEQRHAARLSRRGDS